MRRQAAFIDVLSTAIAAGTIGSHARAQCTESAWRPADPSPTPRYAAGIVADTASRQLLTFGGLYRIGQGLGTTFITNSTWMWDGAASSWARRASFESPVPRDSSALAFDPIRRRIVLFGGCNSQGNELRDTWEFDSDTGQWTQVFPPVSPSARQGAAMVFDPVSGHILMFSGWSDTAVVPNDLWEWDGSLWFQRPQVNAPSARGFMPMVPESSSGRFLMFGGIEFASELSLSETWRFDSTTNTWTRLHPPQEPARRFAHAMMPDPDRGRIVLFGGRSMGVTIGDTWEWLESADVWIERAPVSTPSPREYVSGALDPATRKPVAYGGRTYNTSYQTFSDLWQWNGAEGQWRRLHTNTFPPIGSAHSMAYDADRRRIVYWSNSFANAGTIWEWDGQLWFSIAAPLLGTSLPMAFDGDRIIAVVPTGSQLWTWAWNGATWTRLADCPASFIYPPLLAYDSRRDRVVLFSQGTRQTWEWDRAQWTLRTTLGPPPRLRSVMTFDSARGVTVLHGGQQPGPGQGYGDTWVWDGQVWTNPTTGPVSVDAEMCFDPIRARVVLVSSNGTFTWSGTGLWDWLSGPQAVIRSGGAMAYHEAGGHLLLMGGAPSGALETSSLVTLTFRCSCYANCDNSTAAPTLNANDFQCFLNRFAAGDTYANCDDSLAAPVLNANDFACFLHRFAAGCP